MTVAVPTLTVLMCVKNGATHLPVALESLERQTNSNFEVVLVDDASTDATWEIATASRVVTKTFRGPGLGLAMARNAGLAEVRTPYVTFLDHDDLFHPRRVERILPLCTTAGDTNWFWTGYRTFSNADLDAETDGDLTGSNWPDALIKPGCELDLLAVQDSLIDVAGSERSVLLEHESALTWGAAAAPLVADADLLRRCGGFPVHLGPAEDVLMLVNISRYTPVIEVDQPTYFYRLHSDSETRRMAIPWPYLAAMAGLRFGGQHMTSDRALGRGAPLQRDLVMEDLLAESVARDGFDGALAPLYHMLCLLYPDRGDRRAIFRRIATEMLRTRAPSLDRSLRRLRSALQPTRVHASMRPEKDSGT